MDTDPCAPFNHLPDVTELKEGLKATPDMCSETFAFMLPHRRFFLHEAEALWVEPKAHEGKEVIECRITVVKKNELPYNAGSCMWLYQNGWPPYGYSREEFACLQTPRIPHTGKCLICSRWLSTGGVERIDVKNRVQVVKHDGGRGTITTMCNCVCEIKFVFWPLFAY